MSRRAQENVVIAVLAAVFVLVIVLCQDFGPRARMIPLPLAVFGLILAAIQAVWQNLRSTDELQMDLISIQERSLAAAVPESGKEGKGADRGTAFRQELGAFGIVAALLVLELALGPIPAVFLFTGGYFLLTRHYSVPAGLIYTAVFTAATYGLFFVVLEIQPYHGLLAPLIERFH